MFYNRSFDWFLSDVLLPNGEVGGGEDGMNSDYETTLKASQLDRMKMKWINEGKREGAVQELRTIQKGMDEMHDTRERWSDCFRKLEVDIEKRLKELEGAK